MKKKSSASATTKGKDKAPRKPVSKTAKKAAKASKTSPPTRKTAKTPAKAVRGSQTAKKATKKKATKKTTPKPQATPTHMNFREGSDAAIVWAGIQAGGTSRKDVQTKLESHFSNQVTRGGQPKPVSTVMNQVVRRAIATGEYEIESTWKVVPSAKASPAKGKAAKPRKPSATKAPRKKTASR